MTSEFRIVLSRWAMLTMVMPSSAWEPMSSMVFWIIFSEALSSALVASSRKRSEGFLSKALAMAMRCFWPPENCEPPEPTKVSIWSGRLLIKFSFACFATC
mmetsp:Transcript_28304/g.81486  ORF Transcript_28304/g.81486 Transcript_28304/m.81486 type:complete len:101 (+) Transcript_28304:1268-1570(+)